MFERASAEQGESDVASALRPSGLADLWRLATDQAGAGTLLSTG